MNRLRVLVGVGTIGVVVAAGLAAAPVTAAAAPQDDRGALLADADGELTLRPGFVGVPATTSVDDPAVTRATPVLAAARAHLARYGATIGADPAQLVVRGTSRTVAGQDSVRFAQEVDGVPVIGGEVVVVLRPDRELASALATVSSRAVVATTAVSQAAAAATARAVAARSAEVPVSAVDATSEGRWLLDPQVLGASARLGTHTVWRFDVGDGAAVRRLVLVDVRTGSVVMNADAIESIDRVVCDSANVPVASSSPCTAGFARVEGGPASGVTDVNSAFEFAGAVSDFYDQIGGIDLTDALGISVGGVKKLAATVRFCYLSKPCPYANAFWNGQQMFYGDTYAGADDVVGHEMTHGIIDQYSELFYWGQSGAINESLADIMGEIVDHRYATPGDSATDWRLGEDLPIGAIRDLETPSFGNQPDRMTSALYTANLSYSDSGGVHTNSGVGNKTAYLISQGGTFNGQTITGIDTDAGLTKTATLYLEVIQTLTSGSDYANLATVLDQSCQDLIGTAGFTNANCTAVHAATLATQLSVTPPNAPQPADAPATCPSGTTKRVLFDSETGDPASKFTAGSSWNRGGSAGYGNNATSGRDAWFSSDPSTIGASALTTTSPVSLPAGQESYLWFQQWRLLDYDGSGFYDGGQARIDGAVPSGAWVNGPQQLISTQFGSPIGGQQAFGGDSFGYVASRLSLSPYAGQSVTPSFVMATDSSVGYIGWFLDDITVYTCDLPIENTQRPTVAGKPKVGKLLTAKPGVWSPTGLSFEYRWLRNGTKISGATAKTYRLVKADKGKKISVRVTATLTGSDPASATSKAVGPIT